ncbi:MAG: sigma-70 family RNA polymerase sigma factor [Thermoflexia bacterium]|nr:MAG: sigma-70 family RNA polymerase sigma factor [Thermoflexia bacterium]
MPVFRTFGDDGGRSGVDWEAVYDEYLPRVYNYFRYLVGSQAVAEDLTAAVFEKAWRRRDRYRADRGVLSTWLFALAKNVARDHFRRDHHREVPLEWAGEMADPEPVEEVVAEGEERARLGTLLARLPPRERELVALKYGAGLTNREIARLTGLSETNVGTILHRVVQRLREQWEEEP